MAAPELEGMHRGHDPDSPAPRWYRERVDTRATKRAFLGSTTSGPTFAEIETAKVRELLERSCGAGVTPGRVYLPRFGDGALDVYRYLLAEIAPDVDLIETGHDTGHLGAGDMTAGVAELLHPQRGLDLGESAAVLSAGAGFTWSCAVLRRPEPQGGAE